MGHVSQPRATIIGGSLSGLFTATALRAIGWDVNVFEQSPNELDSRGGGIVLQPDVMEAFRFGGVELPAHPGVDSGEQRDATQHVIAAWYNQGRGYRRTPFSRRKMARPDAAGPRECDCRAFRSSDSGPSSA